MANRIGAIEREVGAIWKEGASWMVQLPRGIVAFNDDPINEKRAMRWSKKSQMQALHKSKQQKIDWSQMSQVRNK